MHSTCIRFFIFASPFLRFTLSIFSSSLIHVQIWPLVLELLPPSQEYFSPNTSTHLRHPGKSHISVSPLTHFQCTPPAFLLPHEPPYFPCYMPVPRHVEVHSASYFTAFFACPPFPAYAGSFPLSITVTVSLQPIWSSNNWTSRSLIVFALSGVTSMSYSGSICTPLSSFLQTMFFLIVHIPLVVSLRT